MPRMINNPDEFGRPPKLIDEKLLRSLCKLQCTAKEICAVIECKEDALSEYVKKNHGCTFQEYFETYSGQGKMSLRRLQFRKAEEGSVPMLIWLGKQYLGQKDGELALNDARACQTFTLKYDTKKALIDQCVEESKREEATVDLIAEAILGEDTPRRTILRKANA